FNDRFTLIYSLDFSNSNGGRGYIQNIGDDIVFGQRDRTTLVNTITGNYNFNVFHALSLSFRNYWSVVTYENQLYTLEDNGRLSTDDGYTLDDVNNPDVNFNTWNLDFGYSWQFAPGSMLTALYRNSLFDFSNASRDTYFNSVGNLFKQPIDHNFSIRVVYFIDYNHVKNIFNKKHS
ncbi:MAG: protein with DOMON-like ligand-binding domain protein, partial [Winogradskyella sp.]|nr:protein with DOMON-like ligand-binding domain protein [Winogradskyella sp.]